MFRLFKALSSSRIFMFIVLIVIGGSFALWGVGDMFNFAGNRNSVATINGKPITYQDFYNRYRRYVQVNQLSSLSPENQRALNIGNRVVDEMVAERIINMETRKLGLQASDAELARIIRNNPIFKDQQTGQFNRIQYESILNANGLSESAYTQSLAQGVMGNQLLASLGGLIANTPALGQALYQVRGEKRTIAYTTLIPSDITTLTPAKQADIESYYADNKTLYTLPTTRTVDYILLSPSDFANTTPISDTAIQDYYTQNKDSYGDPEKRTFTQYLFDSEGDARNARGPLVANTGSKNLESITQTNIAHADLPNTIADTIFALGAGQVSQPLQSDFGWMLVKLTKITPAKTKPLSAVRADIAKTLKADTALDTLYAMVDTIDDATSKQQTLPEIAQAQGLKLRTIKGLTPNGKILSTVTLRDPKAPHADLLSKMAFLNAITELAEGEISLATELSGNRFFVAQARDITEPTIPTLAQIKKRITADYNTTRQQQAVDKQASDMVTALQNGKKLKSIAKTTKTIRNLTRTTALDKSPLNYGMLNRIFETDTGGAFTTMADGKTYVITVQNITPAPKPTPEQQADATTITTQTIADGVLESYDSLLRQTYTVTLNQGAINQVYTP